MFEATIRVKKTTHRRGAAHHEAGVVPAVGLLGPGRVEDVLELAALGVNRITLAIRRQKYVRKRRGLRA